MANKDGYIIWSVVEPPLWEKIWSTNQSVINTIGKNTKIKPPTRHWYMYQLVPYPSISDSLAFRLSSPGEACWHTSAVHLQGHLCGRSARLQGGLHHEPWKDFRCKQWSDGYWNDPMVINASSQHWYPGNSWSQANKLHKKWSKWLLLMINHND